MDVAAATYPALRHHRINARPIQVRHEDAFLVEHDRAYRYVQHDISSAASGLAPACAVRARLGVPARTLLVQGEV